MKGEKTLDAFRSAILDLDDERAVEAAREIVEHNLSDAAMPIATEAIRTIGDRFQEGEIFLPQLIMAGELMKSCMAVLSPHLGKGQLRAAAGKVVMATVKGDIHDIGKNIVCMMMSVSGLDVLDLGTDVAPMEIIQRAEQFGADIIGLSSLMTTSIPQMKEVIALLVAMKRRDKFFVIVGGGPVTREHARSMHADGWAKNAVGAVRVCERLLAAEQRPSQVEFTFEEG
jgi:methylmalonyl-CoA mutase cobalamin-binding domain/chain